MTPCTYDAMYVGPHDDDAPAGDAADNDCGENAVHGAWWTSIQH